jgi:hypothetical protein
VGAQAANASTKYQYWPDGTGLYGALGEISYYEYEGGYWNQQHAAPQPTAFGQAWFSVPTSTPYWEANYTGAMNTCTLNYPPVVTKYTPGAPEIDLVSGAATISLPIDANLDWYYISDAIDPAADIVQGGYYDLEPMVGAAPDWPQFTVTDLLQMPLDAPDVTLPNLSALGFPAVAEASFVIDWDDPHVGGEVYVTATRFQAVAGVYEQVQPLEAVSCVATDDGSFKIPDKIFPSWDAAKDGFLLMVGRAAELKTVLPYDNSQSGVVGIKWDVGFVEAQ